MKKALQILAIISVLSAACTEDKIIDYEVNNLYGEWDQFAPSPTTDGYDSIYHIFLGTTYKIRYFKGDSISSEKEYAYEFDGQIFTYNSGGSDVVNEINRLDNDTLSFTTSLLGTDETIQCERVQ